jgi:hypothetical protein
MMNDQLTHIADVKVGSVKGNSKRYPQLRLPSQYSGLVGKKASLFEINDTGEEVAFIICFSTKKSVAAYNERAERAEASFACAKPCRGSDSGSNPDSGASFLIPAQAQLAPWKISDSAHLSLIPKR